MRLALTSTERNYSCNGGGGGGSGSGGGGVTVTITPPLLLPLPLSLVLRNVVRSAAGNVYKFEAISYIVYFAMCKMEIN